MAILKFGEFRLEKYDVITHTAHARELASRSHAFCVRRRGSARLHVNMVSASAIARISRTQVVEVENCVRGHEVYGAPRSASS